MNWKDHNTRTSWFYIYFSVLRKFAHLEVLFSITHPTEAVA
ncbi:Protein of unknown function [Pyronema omphalodes CBS 100304]|uniref:Uncharacterized protein n=1 Tax=Pyronema omphalodes (strain CBS 100304) TaxID=1076935 RepID=U4L828_PYROM|nr:Protein of unknown function [Pyronema omphalodes CBS 100304]